MSWSAFRSRIILSALTNQLVNTRIDFYNAIVERDGTHYCIFTGLDK